MIHGYARVSTLDQDLSLQFAALNDCPRLWSEKQSSSRHRPELSRMLYSLRAGDVVRVYKLDRLARSLSDLLRIVAHVERVGASLQSVTEPVDTGTPLGRLLVHLLGSFAEFERAVITERCASGRAAALARGVRFGRPRVLDRVTASRLLRGGLSQSEVARLLGCSPSTICHLVKSGELGIVGN